MDVIWCLKNDEEIRFSRDWLKEILEFEKEWCDKERNFSVFEDNVYIIWCEETYNQEFIDYLNEYNERELNYIVIHLSDEAFAHNTEYYKIAKKVWRNYYNKDYSDNYNVSTFPLGQQTGISRKEINKKYMFNFVGQVKSERNDMLQTYFKEREGNFLFLTRMWADPNSLNHEQYSESVSSSYFTICPKGWVNLDSFRICEALECNSIPVVIYDNDGSDYYYNVFGEHPFIISKTWRECKNIIDNMSKSDIENKLLEIEEYWKNFKEELKQKIKEIK